MLLEAHTQLGLEPFRLSVCGSGGNRIGQELGAFFIQEVVANALAVRHNDPEVSFILDIGGQDMKAIGVHDGVVTAIQLNEACSAGCGSFVETYARSLGIAV